MNRSERKINLQSISIALLYIESKPQFEKHKLKKLKIVSLKLSSLKKKSAGNLSIKENQSYWEREGILKLLKSNGIQYRIKRQY